VVRRSLQIAPLVKKGINKQDVTISCGLAPVHTRAISRTTTERRVDDPQPDRIDSTFKYIFDLRNIQCISTEGFAPEDSDIFGQSTTPSPAMT
jgi:hypothetical protein